jgi:Zn-dependent protease
MLPTRNGSIHLFRFLGIDVFLHLSWFVVALIEIQYRSRTYGSLAWNALEYVALFLIVLMHEFGHALACRQVGGQADQIVLWPLGGVAYVSPPQRPGAMLWSIVAGPLVNVALLPILTVVWLWGLRAGWDQTMPNVNTFVYSIWLTNLILLIFNLLPIYPLDGGQILRSLLWFVCGRARSLMVASVIGFVGVAGLALWAVLDRSLMLGVMCVFVLLNCWRGLLTARALARLAAAPRRDGFLCPNCNAAPPVGAFWGCGKCRKPFDTFETYAICPHCGAQFAQTACVECGNLRPISDWMVSPSVPPKIL